MRTCWYLASPLAYYHNFSVGMEWRDVSRSRSSMEWRDTSRSRSRPPHAQNGSSRDYFDYTNESAAHALLTQSEDFNFGHSMSAAAEGQGIPDHSPDPIPIPKSGHVKSENEAYPGSSTTGLPGSIPNGLGITSSGLPNLHIPQPYDHQISAYNNSGFLASSLPVFNTHTNFSDGYGGPNMPMKAESRPFPKHVRKTSFDHTVSRSGISSAGMGGRHQVNGKPLSPGSSLVRPHPCLP